jgi:hypothetical protein
MSDFYKKKNNRTKLISNFLLNSPNTVYSFGYDSGIAAEKINIEKSFFLGIVHVVEVYKKSYFSISRDAHCVACRAAYCVACRVAQTITQRTQLRAA